MSKFTLAHTLDEYETGQLSDDETIELFQDLVDNGLAWELQGHYGRTASALIEQGLITRPDASPRFKPELVGTFCECGAPYDKSFGGYACAR